MRQPILQKIFGEETAPPAMLSRGNILVVDDEVNLCRILDAKLTKSGYEVMTVHDGQQAVEKVQERQFDLVLLDLILPKLDGLEALERIRKINSEVPVIIMTACENTDAVSRAMSHGASAFVSKPFDLDRLVLLVQNTSTEARSLSAETTVMDGSGIFRPGQKIKLETAEKSEGSIDARLLERSQATLRLSLNDQAHSDKFSENDQVQAYIAAPDALYRFPSTVKGIESAGLLLLHLPQVMYRVQRRKFPRVGLKTALTYKEEPSAPAKSGYSEDIGLGGMSLVATAEVPLGQTLLVEADAMLHLEGMKCSGQVLRCDKVTETDHEQWRVALKFTEPNPELRRALLQHLTLSS